MSNAILKPVSDDDLVNGRFYWVDDPTRGEPVVCRACVPNLAERTAGEKPYRKTLRSGVYIVDVGALFNRGGRISGPLENPFPSKAATAFADERTEGAGLIDWRKSHPDEDGILAAIAVVTDGRFVIDDLCGCWEAEFIPDDGDPVRVHRGALIRCLIACDRFAKGIPLV